MPKYEQRDASPRRIAFIGAGLAFAVAVIGVGLWIGMSLLNHTTPNGAQPDIQSGQTGYSPAPPPRLQPYPVLDLAQFRAQEESALHGYGWVDRPSGTIHIPIERAMQLTVAKEAHP